MYFSKNSRYVFKSAQCMPPASYFLDRLKVTTKNLCIKSPKEDPTKPPLRLNIPDDPERKQPSETYYGPNQDKSTTTHRREFSAPRSRSLLSKPTNRQSISIGLDEEYMKVPKSESETQFSSFKDGSSIRSERKSAAGIPQNPDASKLEANQLGNQVIDHFKDRRSEISPNEGLITILDEGYFQDSARGNQILSKSEVEKSQKEPEGSKSDTQLASRQGSNQENNEPKALYIIIDVPEKQQETELSNLEALKGSEKEAKVDRDPAKTAKSDWQGSENALPNGILKARSKSLPKMSTRSNPKIKFQVHEIDEAATYIFHLRFNKKVRDKSVERVPEKELNTRNKGPTDGETQIHAGRVASLGPKTHRGLGREISTIEDPIELVKYEPVKPQTRGPNRDKKEIGQSTTGIKVKSKSMKNLTGQQQQQQQHKPASKPKAPVRDDLLPVQGSDRQESQGDRPQAEETESLYFTYPLINKKVVPYEMTGSGKTKGHNQVAGHYYREEQQQQQQQQAQNVEFNQSQIESNQIQKGGEIASESTNSKVESTVDEYKNYYEYNAQQQVAPDVDQSSGSQEYAYAQQYNVQDNQQKVAAADSNQSSSVEGNKGGERAHLEHYQQQQTAAIDDGKQASVDPNALQQYSVQSNQQTQSESADRNQSAQAGKERGEVESPAQKASKAQPKSGEKKKKVQKGSRVDKNPKKGVKFSTSSEGSMRNDRKSGPKEPIDFQTAGSVVKISSEAPAYPMRYCPAYPPNLNDVICTGLSPKGLGLGKKESIFHPKSNKFNFRTSDHESSDPLAKKVNDLSGNSILFPASQSEKFDCSTLFSCRQEKVEFVDRKVPETEGKSAKAIEKTAEFAGENNLTSEAKGEFSVDSLSVMKKVKEIVDFDLNNVVKIFEGRETDSAREVSSVLMGKEGGPWYVDEEQLERCVTAGRQKGAAAAMGGDYPSPEAEEKQKKIDKAISIPKYFPGRSNPDETMKLTDPAFRSVITFDQVGQNFGINKPDLREAVRKSREEFEILYSEAIIPKKVALLEDEDATEKGPRGLLVEGLTGDFAKSDAWQMKSGDSILVYDELTQTWKVDYSILEKREEQMRQEEELTKRSELILETFEQMEKGNISKVPRPNSREKKIFDYNSEEWKAYKPNEKPNSKSKLPFKESDAEEIRKKNSDLYENLFVVNKKERQINKKEGKKAPGANDPNTKKAAADKNEPPAKMMAEKSGPKEPSDATIKNPEVPAKETDVPASKEEQKKPSTVKEDADFWGNFLKTNILPFDMPEKPKPLQRPPPAPPAPAPPLPEGNKTKELPKIKAPPAVPKKIEEPKFRIPIPFGRDKKIETPKEKMPPVKGDKTIETPAVKAPPPSTGSLKKETPAVKAPPPSTDSLKKEIPDKKAPPPPTGSLKKEIPDKKAPPPPTGSLKKEIPTVKAPPPPTASQKKEKPSVKAPPPSSGTQKKEKPSVKAPPPSSSGQKKETPAVKAPPPSSGTQKKEPPALKESPPSSTQSKQNPPAGDSLSKTSSGVSEPAPSPQTKIDPRKKSPPKIGGPKEDPPKMKALKKSSVDEAIEDPKAKVDGKKDKAQSDHYVSDNIIEMSKNLAKDVISKSKSNKVQTVKLNITSDKRTPSKITEINLNKKFDEVAKETKPKPIEEKKSPSGESLKKKREESTTENRSFYKKFEKYKTPFSDPEYEEKSMKINSDMESNPNLKKLDKWNKTLVLHDVVKPPENIETWLKDETDKMATLLLKVLQEAADGKSKKKPCSTKAKPGDGRPPSGKSNPYETIRKKQETSSHEGFLFKVRSVNLALEADKRAKSAADQRPNAASGPPVESAKMSRTVDAVSVAPEKEAPLQSPPGGKSLNNNQSRLIFAEPKPKLTELTLEPIEPNLSREAMQAKAVRELTDDIPGPRILKTISSTWKLFPLIGCQMTIFTLLRIFQLVNLGSSFLNPARPDKSRRHAFSKLFAKYGPIVNLQGPLSGNVILIHKPEHLSAVFEQDSASAVRSVFDSLDQSRRGVEDQIVATGIPVDWSQPQWNNLKKASWNPMGKDCEKHFGSVELAGDSLVNNVRRNRNGQNIGSEDFIEEIKRWSLEGLCSVLFAKSYGFLESRSSNVSWLLEPDKLYMAVEEASDYLFKCERGFQIWRLMATPSLIGLGQAYRSLAGIISKQLYQAELNLKNKNELVNFNTSSNSLGGLELTYIESMLLFDGLTPEEITCSLIDVLLLGTNAMASAFGFLLYQLAQNVKVQHKLLNEVKQILPDKSSRFKYQKLNSLKYLQACLKESLRLNTPFPLIFRLLQNDIFLSNYIVPKGTYVVMDSRVTCMKEQIFDEPEKFMPERWLKDEKWVHNAHPFSSFPLCHGPRSDLAKRIVEMQLCSCVAKIVRNFEIEYHFGEIAGTENIISFPDKPLKLNFVERSD